MTVGENTLYFSYNAAGTPMSVKYGSEEYFYTTNIQGDVTGIVNSNGVTVVTYTYDAWGRQLSCTGSMAGTLGVINPLRYRGYVYDQESGLYYLQSRYYDPNLGRFINADGLISTGQGLLGNNMFAYCGNNPVMRIDPSGMSWKDLIDKILHKGNSAAKKAGIDTASIGALFLQMEKDGNGIYHARTNCWQQYFGYNSLYDYMFDIGTSMETKYFDFACNDMNYRIWVWKGDYINLGAGAEIGIYRYGAHGHWVVDRSLAMPMTLTLRYKGKYIINYQDGGTQWWCTGFNPAHQNVNANELTAGYRLFFNDSDMYAAFSATGAKGWLFIDEYQVAIYAF